MVLKFLYRFWNGESGGAADAHASGWPLPDDLDSGDTAENDPLDTALAERRRKRREEDEQAQRQIRLREENAERKQKQDEEDLEWLLLVTTEFQRSLARLSVDIDDAISAVRLACERGVQEQERALGALLEAEANAIVLSDGRRVYFTRDGRWLYFEDGREVLDETLTAEARGLHGSMPGATDHETHVERERQFAIATEQAERLSESLRRLEELKERIGAGAVTPDNLEEARRQMEDIVRFLPPDVRQDYDRIRAARQSGGGIAYRDAEAALQSVPDIGAQFLQASAPQLPASGQNDAGSDPARKPAYRAAPGVLG